MSYANIILLGATIPSYEAEKSDDEIKINADDSSNNERIMRMFAKYNN